MHILSQTVLPFNVSTDLFFRFQINHVGVFNLRGLTAFKNLLSIVLDRSRNPPITLRHPSITVRHQGIRRRGTLWSRDGIMIHGKRKHNDMTEKEGRKCFI